MKTAGILAAILVALLSGDVRAEANKAASTPAPTAQQHFASPQEAATALVAAVKKGDQPAALAVLGSAARSIVESGDEVADREVSERFVAGYEEAHSLRETNARRYELVIGRDDWPFPIPIVKESAGWRFDTAAGREEILARRVGRNERFTIQTCLAIVDAQREYNSRNPANDPLPHYARRFNSSEGKRDGLYYPTADGEEESPLGALVAQARDQGYTGKPTPYNGYYYRILEAQGPHARDGAYSYIAGGEMIGGFAVVAYPATYANSGVMTFIVNQDGVVYQKDLGPDTAKRAREIERYDPDPSWERVPDEDQSPEPST